MRRLLIPEVLETAAIDCGLAAVQSLLDGFYAGVSIGRFREACAAVDDGTGMEGVSLDRLEAIAGRLGMPLTQKLVPADLLLLRDSECLPALVAVDLPDRGLHFVVLWRTHGRWLQVMDPAVGRIWMPRERLLSRLYLHEQWVPAAAARDWLRSAVFTAGLMARLHALGVSTMFWRDGALQDAALRLAATLHAAGNLRAGSDVREFLEECADNPQDIPRQYWSLLPHPTDPRRCLIRAAVALSARAPLAAAATPTRVEVVAATRPWQPAWRIAAGAPATAQAGRARVDRADTDAGLRPTLIGIKTRGRRDLPLASGIPVARRSPASGR